MPFLTEHSPRVSLHFCTSDSWGGLEVYAGTLMTELARSGFAVLAVCAPGSRLESYLHDRGIETVTLPNSAKISIASLRAIRLLITDRNVSVVHVHFHKDIWLASLALRKDCSRKLMMSIYMGVGPKRDLLHRWIYSRVDAVFTSSKALNAVLPERYPISADKIHYLPYGRILAPYIADKAKREVIRKKFGIPFDAPVAGTMVRIDPGKGVLEFLESFLYLDEELRQRVYYVIVGEPTRKSRAGTGESPFEANAESYLEECRTFVHEHKLEGRIIFAGYQADLVGYLSAFDLFVFPSRDEMYSLAMLDAMAMRLPIVAARSGGNLLQVEEGRNGLLYDLGSPASLAASLTEYIRNEDLRCRHGAAAREFVEREHEMVQVIEQLKQYYRSGTP